MRAAPRRLRTIGAALILSAAASVHAAPTTFTPVVGGALLCRHEIDNAYFMRYLSQAFGPPYKHEGGAWWFKADGLLWGQAVTDVMISDDSSALVFIAAVAETTPDALETAIRQEAGIAFRRIETTAFPLRESQPGSRIAFANTKAKIYCAKFKPLRGR